jgi:hypothetical protein
MESRIGLKNKPMNGSVLGIELQNIVTDAIKTAENVLENKKRTPKQIN